jgi:hypothetical protein
MKFIKMESIMGFKTTLNGKILKVIQHFINKYINKLIFKLIRY